MTADLNTAASAILGVPVNMQLGTSEAEVYTSTDVGTTGTLRLTNTDSSSRTPLISQVKSGGTGGAPGTRIFARALTAGESVYIPFKLGDGDFLTGKCSTASVIDVVVDDVEYSAVPSGGALSGIQDDAIGTGGRTSGSGVATGTNAIGTRNDRYLLAALMCTMTTTSTSYTTYDSLTMSCTAGSMTKLASVDFNDGGSLGSSIHLFGIANPTSGSTQTLTTNVAKSGKSFNLTMASISLSGVASVTGVASTGPSSAAAMSLAVTSAAGHRPFFAAGFDTTPMDFNQRVRAFNGNPAVAFTRPHWLILADALGAATVTATTSSSQAYCAVGIDLVPA